MAAAAVVPAASELVMIYAGAVASGHVSGHVILFGDRIHSHAWAYVTVAVAGLLGNTLGAVGGWLIGFYGGRPLLERYGKWLHVTERRMERAGGWFDRRSEEHTSELQSPCNLVCRLLLVKKKKHS